MRTHFKEPTDNQIQKLWTKKQTMLGVQSILTKIPKESRADLIVFDKLLNTYSKMAGFFLPDTTVNTANNLIFVTKAENKEAWQQQAMQQQNELRRKTKMATDSGVNSRDSG